MVQKQAAYNRDPASNAFADDDPLAELARLVGYDAPLSHRTDAHRAQQRRVEPQVSVPASAPAAHQPVDLQNELLHDLDGYGDERQSFTAVEPLAYAENTIDRTPLPQDTPDNEVSLADELLWSMSEVAVEPQHVRSGGADPSQGYGSHRLPLANFNPVRSAPVPQQEPPVLRNDPVPQIEPMAAHVAKAAVREPELSEDFLPEARANLGTFAVEPERRAAPVAHQEPVFEALSSPRREMPRFFDDVAVDNPAPTAAHQPRPIEPRLDSSPAVEEPEDEFFAGDLELDLAEIELDMSEFEPEPVVSRTAPQSVAPDVAVRREVPVQRDVIAPQPSYEGVSREPQLSSYPVEEPSLPPPLPFDAAAISDQDEQLEVLAHLDVPDLPPVEEEKPASFATDYDFDIDSELANLLDKTAEQHPIPQPVPVRPTPAPVAASAVPPIAEQVRNMPSDDFDVFEKALEEDFRRSLDTQYSFGAKQPIAEPEALEADDYEEEEPSSSRRWIAIAAAAAVVLVASGGVYAWMKSSGGEVLGGGEPKIVMADKDPVKVVPTNPGGKSVPNQNKAVYDRVSGTGAEQPAQKNLISSEEEPMDVAQRTLGPDNLPMDDEAGADNANVDANANAGAQPADPAAKADPGLAPRRVKTMIVRPDGSLVTQDGPATAAGAQTANAATAPAQSTSGQTVNDVLASGDAQAAAPAEASDAGGVAAPNMPVPLSRPTQTAAATPAAATKPATLAAPQPAASSTVAASTPTAAGDYLIQISSLPTEADAQKSYKSLSAKFGSVIGGRGMNIKAAEVAGKGTYYRVRIPAGSKDAAVQLCERYRAAGGSCMVVR